ncbi:MAG: membrane lipoprotein lipid attachment site-containing protein [Rhodospirillaceae bacterium]|nr:membrane lipoprotein lipid attachment site-containing protein [Rhodospirillaceae bacterium]
MRRYVLTATAALMLASCNGSPDPVIRQLTGYSCGKPGSTAPSPLCATRPPGEGEAAVSRYCYQTLGDANCFDRPDPDRKNQQLGSNGY